MSKYYEVSFYDGKTSQGRTVKAESAEKAIWYVEQRAKGYYGDVKAYAREISEGEARKYEKRGRKILTFEPGTER